jgi:predicted secreted acid phosphatase
MSWKKNKQCVICLEIDETILVEAATGIQHLTGTGNIDRY